MGYPNSWMVYFMENPTEMDENWGVPPFQEVSPYGYRPSRAPVTDMGECAPAA